MTIPGPSSRRMSRPAVAAAPASGPALLLAITLAPMAALAAFTPARIARVAAPLAAAVLVAGIAGEITHIGLFFVPALAAMAVAGVMLWREGS
jgi:hypothetical protein